MILVDTNIIIDFWKKPDERITEIIENEEIAICGVVKAELIHGARSEEDIDRILKAVSCFNCLQYSNDWEGLGKMLYRFRVAGITLPITDVIIAQIAMEHNVTLLSGDRHFEMIKKVYPAFMLQAV